MQAVSLFAGQPSSDVFEHIWMGDAILKLPIAALFFRPTNPSWPEQAGLGRAWQPMATLSHTFCPARSDEKLAVCYEFQHAVDQAGIKLVAQQV
jgi:hypothetical protein